MTPRFAMQAIHVLRDEREVRDTLLHLRQREVTGVRLHATHFFAAHGVPVPDQFRVARERFGGGQIFGTVLRPKSRLRVAEGAESRFLRDARPGQRGDAFGLSEKL